MIFTNSFYQGVNRHLIQSFSTPLSTTIVTNTSVHTVDNPVDNLAEIVGSLLCMGITLRGC